MAIFSCHPLAEPPVYPYQANIGHKILHILYSGNLRALLEIVLFCLSSYLLLSLTLPDWDTTNNSSKIFYVVRSILASIYISNLTMGFLWQRMLSKIDWFITKTYVSPYQDEEREYRNYQSWRKYGHTRRDRSCKCNSISLSMRAIDVTGDVSTLVLFARRHVVPRSHSTCSPEGGIRESRASSFRGRRYVLYRVLSRLVG